MQIIGNRSFVMDGEIYDMPTKEAIRAATGLVSVAKKLGFPEDISTEKGRSLMSNVINCWQKEFPQEYRDWIEKKKDYQSTERSISDHSKSGGYQLMSFPSTFYMMVKAVFPKMKLNNRKILRQFATDFDLFKLTQYKAGRKK